MSDQNNSYNVTEKKNSITDEQNSIQKKQTDTSDLFMQSDIVDQINYNQQSNMTISAYSVITQSFSTVKINVSNN
ncbi:hypothetical protein GM661_09505 [Iocasia frigidifontis]|uniref:Uncharacterized protein n=1 Tax=Iocasia fonsfrigidae TaxID=2682810 RepID=A0A8A7KFD5_9FIRM|nr:MULTISPECIES: hypothetical protein [Halanaerobiaceae]AZO95320.1 hypothetical protein D7D81_12340 [Halocella sp. SP3-1]QTL98199.1 hypothetical protein GM661_09505 [Iocasia fonsfrigidae]